MPPTPPLIRCQSPGCVAILGTLKHGDLFPADHLVPGRDLWFQRDGMAVLVCPICRREHRIPTWDGRTRRKAVTG